MSAILTLVEVPSLSVAVARRVRAIREEGGVTADQLAEAARFVGLGWQRGTVASLETGRREVTAAELLLLPLILGRCGVDATLLDLLAQPAALSAGVVAEPYGFRELLHGDNLTVAGEGAGFAIPAVQADLSTFPKITSELVHEIKAQLPGRVRLADIEAAARSAKLDAEQKAAVKLGRSPVQVAHAAHALWGQGLTAERDARVAEKAPPDAEARSLQAIRGRVTRSLLAELEPVLRAYPPRET